MTGQVVVQPIRTNVVCSLVTSPYLGDSWIKGQLMRIIFYWSTLGVKPSLCAKPTLSDHWPYTQTDLKRMTYPMGRRVRLMIQPPIPTTHHLRVSHGLAWGPLICPYMEITCTSRPKILPHNQISYIWEGDPKYIGILLSTRKFHRINGFGSTLHYYINHKPKHSWGMWILSNSCTVKFLEILLSLT